MLHILFIILKILGILLLVILGLLFLCLMAVLFVPIRYRGNGSYHSIKDFGVHLHIHWLLHAVSLRIAYEMGFDMRLSCLDSGFSGVRVKRKIRNLGVCGKARRQRIRMSWNL